jgi:hypothetical protein
LVVVVLLVVLLVILVLVLVVVLVLVPVLALVVTEAALPSRLCSIARQLNGRALDVAVAGLHVNSLSFGDHVH